MGLRLYMSKQSEGRLSCGLEVSAKAVKEDVASSLCPGHEPGEGGIAGNLH